jgi:sulfur-oxidizing protein SoxY
LPGPNLLRTVLFRTALLGSALLGLTALALPAARADDIEANRAARWHDVAAAVFNGRSVTDGNGLVEIDAPLRAMDAALVPITITIRPDAKVVGLTLVIDDNPAPVAAKFHFGPLADPHLVKTRVRVDQYTLIHAVAELQDGSLVSAVRFIKAAGGCSAPGTEDSSAALARLGRMKLRLQPASRAGGPVTADLLVSHPNFNGMQMNPVTRLYTPARYVQTVRVTEAGKEVFTMEGDISLAEDPAIGFAFHPSGTAPLDVEVDDSAKAVFRQTFPLETHAS